MTGPRLSWLGALAFALGSLHFASTVLDSDPEAQAGTFGAVEIWIDAGAERLGAWQVELSGPDGLRYSAVEGGEAGAFEEAPTYDPAALLGGRLILAAYAGAPERDGEPPSGRVRVARVHYLAPNSNSVAFERSGTVTADSEGRRRDFEVTLVPSRP